MRIAIGRTLRVGRNNGTELEDLGVVPDERHQLTRRDVLEGNVDLIEKAASLLAGMPRYQLDATVTKLAGKVRVDVRTGNIERLDLAIDGRPQRSDDVVDGDHSIELATALARGIVSLSGYKDGELVAAARVKF
jgi:hypothetical protein